MMGYLIASIFKSSGNLDNSVPIDAKLKWDKWGLIEN